MQTTVTLTGYVPLSASLSKPIPRTNKKSMEGKNQVSQNLVRIKIVDYASRIIRWYKDLSIFSCKLFTLVYSSESSRSMNSIKFK